MRAVRRLGFDAMHRPGPGVPGAPRDRAQVVLDGVGPDQAGLPTPCRSWDLQALVDHVIYDLERFSAVARGEQVDWRAAAPRVDSDWAAAFWRQVPSLLDSWRAAGDLSRTRNLAIGELPLSFLVNQQVAEFATHSWDVATATGQRVDWNLDVGAAALAWARTALQPAMRGDEASGRTFGPQVLLAADAPVYDQLAAFFGRTPPPAAR